jgi:hypothetical protein
MYAWIEMKAREVIPRTTAAKVTIVCARGGLSLKENLIYLRGLMQN